MAIKLFLFTIISTVTILLLDKSNGQNGRIACSEAFCKNQNCTVPSCGDGQELVKKGGICQCCDACYNLLYEGQRCVRSPKFHGGGPFLAKCAAGLQCNGEICIKGQYSR